ncbi:hypothetical protein [Aggregatilinea lenta]|uniref:hypothetical protein n=1 Tax=Aggregatilinea lenta TaxID=913108 RepID=UPI000E5B0E68|nr:hypothetical protein [Aggregatilinea lenta]
MTPLRAELPHTVREINDLPNDDKLAIYRALVPEWVFPMFGIDRDSYSVRGERVVHVRCPSGSRSVELTIYHEPGAADPALYLQMGDTVNSQLAVLMVIVNDPYAPRFNIDTDENGQPTQLGTRSRNIPEEIRAMEAGLAPGQIRRGLRLFRTAVPLFEAFIRQMQHEMFFIEPLFYHNAIAFERYGFAYERGAGSMRSIHERFLPGGDLHARLDDTTPFRRSQAASTVLGRSWAIHDGILGQPLTGIHMYKRVGHAANIRTFPDSMW